MLALVAVIVRAVVARLPGLDPASLWYDDLIIAATVRTDFWSMLTVPLHVSPGLLVVWRGLYTLLPDPEWSLQLLPFVCSIAGIPLMALVVRELTRDNGLAVLAAAVTALNPLLARYSVFVHQYAVEFAMTALFLLAATRLYSGRTSDLDPRRFVGVAFAAGLAPLFSVTSVFISFPLVSAAYAVRVSRLMALVVRSVLTRVSCGHRRGGGRAGFQRQPAGSPGALPLRGPRESLAIQSTPCVELR